MNSLYQKSLVCLTDYCKSLQQIKQVHAKAIILGLTYNEFILNKVLHSFLTFRSLDYATRIFDRTHEHEPLVYNLMIKAYASSDTPLVAISMYNKLRVIKGVVGDNFTFPFVFKACTSLFAVEKGRETHGVIVRIGYGLDPFSKSALLNFYCVCGDIDSARRIFDEFIDKDIVFWNAMISGYARAGMVHEAFDVFEEMTRVEEVKPNQATILGLISACGASKNLTLGRIIHGCVLKQIYSCEGVKLESSLISMYVKCSCLEEARIVFDNMPERNVVVWNSLICGYSQIGSLLHTVQLFRQMLLSKISPDVFTISAMLSACARTGAFNTGNLVRGFADRKGIYDVYVGTCLIDMYAKCGFLEVAREVFNEMPKRSVSTWNVILSGYALHGKAEFTLELFESMKEAGLRPDSVTFLAILHACAHTGLLREGKRYFDLMTKDYKITPKVEHYGCMVDLLGRAGLLREARLLIEDMKIEPNAVVWGTLLSACIKHRDIEIGEWTARNIFESDATMDGGCFVLLANHYMMTQRFACVKAVRKMMSEKRIFKQPGCSIIEIGDALHEFIVADKNHPRSKDIYMVLDVLSKELKVAGYVPMIALDEEGF